MTISAADSVAILLAVASFVATILGFLIAAVGIWWSARAERKKQQAAYDEQRNGEAEELLRIIAYADEVYAWNHKGERGISTPLQGLAAALLREHPNHLPTMILLREQLRKTFKGDISWTSVQLWLDQTIAFHQGKPEPAAPTI